MYGYKFGRAFLGIGMDLVACDSVDSLRSHWDTMFTRLDADDRATNAPGPLGGEEEWMRGGGGGPATLCFCESFVQSPPSFGFPFSLSSFLFSLFSFSVLFPVFNFLFFPARFFPPLLPLQNPKI